MRFLAPGLLLTFLAGGVFAGAWQTKSLTIWGDGFKFSVSPPVRWSARSGNPPRFVNQANLMVWPRPRGVAAPLVTVDAAMKTGKTLQDEMKGILAHYMKTRQEAKIEDLKFRHDKYAVAGKSVSIAGRYHEYIVFLDPGKEYRYWLVAKMKSMPKAANGTEMNSFSEIIKSITYIGDIPLPTTTTNTGSGEAPQ